MFKAVTWSMFFLVCRLQSLNMGQTILSFPYYPVTSQFLPPQGFGPDPAYKEENFAVPEKISIFENTARKGLPKVRWGSNKQAKDSGSVFYTTRC